MTDLVVMALDIAKHRTGWAVGAPVWPRPHWGVHELDGAWDGREGLCLKAWRSFLINQIARHGVTYMTVEQFMIDMRDFNFNGTVPIAQMHGIVLELCEERSIKVGRASIASWRKRFLGTAVAPAGMPSKLRTDWWKKQAVTACTDRNWYVTHHDEAEAIGILDFTMAALDEDYAHRVGPTVRRMEWKREQDAFRGAAA